MLPPHWVVPPSGGAAWGRRRAETHEAAHRRGFRGVKRRARRIFASREAIGCVIRSSACCNPTTALQGIDRTCVTAPSPTPTLTRTSRRDRGRTAAESGHVRPIVLFSHPPTLLVRGSFWAAQRRRCHQRRTRSGGSAQAMEGPADRGRHRQQAAAARAHQRRQRPRAHPQQLQQRRRRRQLQLPPAASPLAARGGSQCEPPDPGRLGPRSAGGCRRFNLQQPTLGRSAKGAHGPVGWQLAAAPLGCAPERLRGLGSGGARGHMETRGDAGFGG